MANSAVILFGATGDLSRQKLFPALLSNYRKDTPSAPRIVAVGRKEHTNESFRQYLQGILSGEALDAFLKTVDYFQLDMLKPEGYAQLDAFAGSVPRVIYLAIPPQHYAEVLRNIAASGLASETTDRFVRIVVEKPFGHDQQSAQDLQRLISQSFADHQVYRVDHYLGKETVQNILAFRFANRLFEPLWTAEHIDHVQITVAEEEGILSRGAYYDAAGAFRDIVQNHLLQLLTVICLEEPSALSYDELSQAREAVLKAVRVDPELSVFGQYEGYLQEAAVREGSTTETFAMAGLQVDTPRWKGVPFYLRTGKKLATRLAEISIQFKPTADSLFTTRDARTAENVLTFRLQPDEGISLRMSVKTPGERMAVQPVRMEFCYGLSFREKLPDAYELVFEDALNSERIHTISPGSVEESWRIVDTILKEPSTTHIYPQGSWGPELADQLLEKVGRRWLASESEICNGVIIEPM